MALNQTKRDWVFQLGLVLILALATALRFGGVGFSLPYVDHPDEPNFYLVAQYWRGQFNPNPDIEYLYRGYPPAYIALQVVLLPQIEGWRGSGLAEAVRVLRWLSALADLATLVLIALTARQLEGNIAGWIGGVCWALAPLVVKNNILALPDPWVPTLTMAALWLAVVAYKQSDRRWWALLSVIAGILAILFKYPVLSVIVPGGLVSLLMLTRPSERHTGLRILVSQALLVVAVAGWLWFGYQFSDAFYAEGAEATTNGLSNMLNPERLSNNLYFTLYPFQPGIIVLLLGGLIAWWLLGLHGQSRTEMPVLALLLILILTIPWLAATFSLVTESNRIRDVLPASAVVAVVIGLAAAWIVKVVPSRYRTLATAGLGTMLLVGIWLPSFRNLLPWVEDAQRPDRRVWLREWFDQNLDPGAVLVDADNHKTFNPIWGGIPHRQWVDWIETDSLTSRSPAQWRDEQGISYVAVGRSEVSRLEQSPEGRAFLEVMLPLRDFYAPPLARGPEMRFYRLWRMQTEAQIQFGESIQLIGYDLESESQAILPGSSITFRFYWKTSSTPVDNYSLFVHLSTLDDYDVLAQVDSTPATAERPTLTWGDRSETLISPRLTLRVPPELEPGTYRLMIGLYNYTTGVRLAPVGVDSVVESDALQLMDVTIAER
ncbi:MAG: glycosyltransferase family 39 protein [Anaerolineae bacterium]|nr:glycosyltransferase family 39 protein [Anaerolineae bacterium]